MKTDTQFMVEWSKTFYLWHFDSQHCNSVGNVISVLNCFSDSVICLFFPLFMMSAFRFIFLYLYLSCSWRSHFLIVCFSFVFWQIVWRSHSLSFPCFPLSVIISPPLLWSVFHRSITYTVFISDLEYNMEMTHLSTTAVVRSKLISMFHCS